MRIDHEPPPAGAVQLKRAIGMRDGDQLARRCHRDTERRSVGVDRRHVEDLHRPREDATRDVDPIGRACRGTDRAEQADRRGGIGLDRDLRRADEERVEVGGALGGELARVDDADGAEGGDADGAEGGDADAGTTAAGAAGGEVARQRRAGGAGGGAKQALGALQVAAGEQRIRRGRARPLGRFFV
jgi:hypothetical protein